MGNVCSPRKQTQLSCAEEKGHCSERIDSLEPRLILEGVERLLWPVGLALCYFGARVRPETNREAQNYSVAKSAKGS